jgi:hypothetical protein
VWWMENKAGEGSKGLGCSFPLTELRSFSLAAVSASQPSATSAATTNVAAIAAAAAAVIRAKASQWTLFANSTLANALFVEQFRWGCELGVGAGWWGVELLGVFGKAEGGGRKQQQHLQQQAGQGRPGQMQQMFAAVQVAAQQHDTQSRSSMMHRSRDGGRGQRRAAQGTPAGEAVKVGTSSSSSSMTGQGLRTRAVSTFASRGCQQRAPPFDPCQHKL